MAEVVLFHHVQGLTPGVLAFADALRASGHTVHTPDLMDGRTYDSIEAGFAALGDGGPEALTERSRAAVADLPAEVVFAGFSLGVMCAQPLAQNRPGARGALLFHSCVDPAHFGAWPDGLPAQVHGMTGDSFFADEGDLDAARALAAAHPEVEVFTYDGDQHLFADSSLPSYDEQAAALLLERVLAFLDEHAPDGPA